MTFNSFTVWNYPESSGVYGGVAKEPALGASSPWLRWTLLLVSAGAVAVSLFLAFSPTPPPSGSTGSCGSVVHPTPNYKFHATTTPVDVPTSVCENPVQHRREELLVVVLIAVGLVSTLVLAEARLRLRKLLPGRRSASHS